MSASPERLILMLCDGALAAMKTAQEGFDIEDLRRRNETISNNLIKAQNIFGELQRSLRPDVGGEFPERMSSLYEFYNAKLNEANFRKDRAPIELVTRLFKEIRDAWAEALMKQAPAAQPTRAVAARNAPGVGAGISMMA